jgi:cytochrome c-type biogenesis protein CcmH/NrfG
MRQKLVGLDPKNAPYQFALAQDAAAGQQYPTAAKALKAYLDLEPNLDKATRKQLEQALKQLQAFAVAPSSP